MNKFWILTLMCGMCAIPIFAQDNASLASDLPASVIGFYQSQCPFVATEFGSTDGVVTALVPPTSPLVIKIDGNWSTEWLKERIDEIWEKHIQEVLDDWVQRTGFGRCAKACYELGVPMLIEYHSTLDNKTISTPISVEQINKLFEKKK